MKKQSFNFHTHTYRCGHAVGREEEYVEKAIEAGFKVLGFSEHIGFEGFDNPRERIAFADMPKYFEDINALKKRYADRIKIFTGLEFEFFHDKIEYLKEMRQCVDYMILGQHCRDRKGYDYTYKATDADVRYMAQQVCEALELGLSKYVAHPDYFMLPRDTFSKDCEIAIREIVAAAKKNEAVIEINLKGMRYGRRQFEGYTSYIYPHVKSLEIYEEEKPQLVIGYDAHNPDVLLQREYEKEAREMVKECGYCEEYKKIVEY